MVITLSAVIIFGLTSILLSLEIDKLKKDSAEEKQREEDKIYKLSVIKDIQEKIAYTADSQKVIDVVMASLRNFFSYSVAASMVIKDAHIILTTYIEESVGSQYVKRIEESMLSSFEKLVGRLPLRIERKMYGLSIANLNEEVYSSSFHIPLVANNKVLALIHLSSMAKNAYSNSNMEDLRQIIDTASSALTHFNQAVSSETEKFSSLISSMNDGIFMLDNKNNLLEINDSAKKILGIPVNSGLFEILNVFPQDLNLENKINKTILAKNSYFEKEVQINSKILDIYISPVGTDKASVILRDVTERKKKETEKEDLINIMVHELRAPATTIKDSAELIISTKDALEEDKKLKFLQIIHSQAKKVLGQVGSILDTAKLDAGKLVLQKTKGDIAKLIQNEIQAFMPQAERKNISLDFEMINESVPSISFDEIRIEQVIDNLLSNSLKFTPVGGKIKASVDYRVIPPTINDQSTIGEFLSLDKFIVISVSDNGVGITPEQQKLLFSKYSQAKNTTEEVATKGTGLGLYLAKGIIETHEGRIWVKSAQGQGTTFFFTLPATEDAKTSYEAPKPTATPLVKLSQTIN
jgi:signal transduction histidine kinase